MTVADVALKYVGQKEKTGNHGFHDPAFFERMKARGWQDGHAWCAYFAELVCVEAMPTSEAVFNKLFSPSAVQTFKNFKAAGFKILELPKPNTVVVWQRYEKGKATVFGHVGIVTQVNGDGSWISVEGNTNASGSSEGDSVQPKHRSNIKKENGLNLLGFIVV